MAEFKVQRVQYDVPNPSGTQAITAVSSLNNAFELLGNNRKCSAGSISTAGNLESDDLTATVVLTATNTLTYSRVGASSGFSMRTNTEVIEYLGTAGGANEFIVRGRYSKNINSATESGTVVLSGITDIKKCIPVITGIYNDNAVDGAAGSTAYITIDSTTQATVHVGGSLGRKTIKFVVIEFTGSAWSVGHGYAASNADTGSISLVQEANGVSTGTAFDVSDWATACIFGQHRSDALSDVNQAIADNWPVFKPNALTTKVDWAFHADHDAASNRHMVHVLKHAQMSVQRISDTQALQGFMNVAIPTALADLAQAFVLVSRTSSGTGTAYGRGWVNAKLDTVSNVKLWCHRSGNIVATEVQVVDLSNILPPSLRRIFIA